MPLSLRTPLPPSLQRGNIARHPGESAYPHLWQGAVLLMAPGLGYQGRRLIDWSTSVKSLVGGTGTSDGTILQPASSQEPLWSVDGGQRNSDADQEPFQSRPQSSARYQLAFNITGINTGERVVVPHHHALGLTTAGTIMFWAKVNEWNITTNPLLVAKGNENYGFYLTNNTGNLNIEWFNGSYRTLVFTAPSSPTLGQWHHYAITFDNLSMQGYRDGIRLGASQTMPAAMVVNTSDLYLYNHADFTTNLLRGAMDDIRIYNRPLDHSEIIQSHQIDLAPYQIRPRIWVVGGDEPGTTVLTPPPARVQVQVQTPIQNRTLQVPRVQIQGQVNTPILAQVLQPNPVQAQYKTPAPVITNADVIPGFLAAKYQTQTPRIDRIALPSAATLQWQTPAVVVTLGILARPAQIQTQAPLTPIDRIVRPDPAQAVLRVLNPMATLTLPPRVLAPAYSQAFAAPFVQGDWLVRFLDIGVNCSFSYDPDGTWIHRIVNFSDIEVSVPPGGGIASVSNVTIQMAEDDQGTNLLAYWDLYGSIQGTRVTISFLLDGQPLDSAFEVFTGYVDRISIKDAISEFICVDNSIQQNLLLPRELVTIEAFPQADPNALTRAKPLLYGSGTYPPSHGRTATLAAPLLFVDIQQNVYLVAGHAITLGGGLALYDTETNRFLPLNDGLVTVVDGLITLGISDSSVMTVGGSQGVTNASLARDGDVTTVALLRTDVADSTGDGIGVLRLNPGVNGYPNTTTIQVTLAGHRRAPGSDPTCTGTFVFRTINSQTLDPAQIFLSVGPFNHVTSAQDNIYTLSNVVIPLNELFEVYAISRNTGVVSNASNVYQLGEVSITPLVTYTAASGMSSTTTLIANAVPLQEMRFNYLQPPLHVEWQQGVENATYAIDQNSTTLARIGTTVLDSSLDGIGELIVATSGLEAQRANNTLVVNLTNHRRGPSSAPTVTGTVSLQTLHPVQPGSTGPIAILRDNLFTTQSFRHVLNPRNTSFTAPSINLGANGRIGIRILAREEGGVGSGTQTYDIGEVSLESFHQPSGDSTDLFLYGSTWAGRRDTTGVLSYQQGASPIGTLYHHADEIIASLLVDELGLTVDSDLFYYASVYYRAMGYFLDGGLGAGWAVERGNARQILDDVAKQSAALLFPIWSGDWGLRAYGQTQTETQIFTTANILRETSARGVEDPTNFRSSFSLDLGTLETVHTRFEVHYQYNVGSQKYDGLLYADHEGTNSPDGTDLTTQCAQAHTKYGVLEPLVIEAYWIQDPEAARFLLRHLVGYFSDQRITVQFAVPINYITMTIGEPIRVIYPVIPASECEDEDQDLGALFEIHQLRITPLAGRITVSASKKKVT